VQNCGVYQYGYRTSQAIIKSSKFNITYVEIDSEAEFQHYTQSLAPIAVIYNYYPSTMPWLTPKVQNESRSRFKQIAIFHEVPLTGFDYHIYVDPTTTEDATHSPVGRPLLKFNGIYQENKVPVFGTFGFAFGEKGYTRLIQLVNSEFDEAIVNIHIAFANFGDAAGTIARSAAASCRSIDHKPGIKVNVSHEFMSNDEILDFLASNSLNAFLYGTASNRGPASTIDYALSVKRPIAITKNNQFIHIRTTSPSICVEENSLSAILENGTKPLERFYKAWSNENLLQDYERILSKICG